MEFSTVEDDQTEQKESVTWDYVALLARVRNNQKLADELIQLFLDDLPDLSKQLQSAVAAESLEDIIAYSHRIKGSAANLSAILLSEMAANIETCGRKENLEEIKDKMDDFAQQVGELTLLLAEHL